MLQGATPKVRFTVTDPATNQLVNPTDAILKVRKPDGTVLGPYSFSGATLDRPSTGTFEKAILHDLGGIWTYEAVTTGTYPWAKGWTEEVEDSVFS